MLTKKVRTTHTQIVVSNAPKTPKLNEKYSFDFLCK